MDDVNSSRVSFSTLTPPIDCLIQYDLLSVPKCLPNINLVKITALKKSHDNFLPGTEPPRFFVACRSSPDLVTRAS